MHRRDFLHWIGLSCAATVLPAQDQKNTTSYFLTDQFKQNAGGPSIASLALPADVKITAITSTRFEARHPRKIGRNSFRDHGAGGSQPLVRVQTSAGVEGIGNELPPAALGKTLGDLLEVRDNRLHVKPPARELIGPACESVLLDIVGKLANRHASELLGPGVRRQVPCYDGSIYMRDLDSGDAAIAEDMRNGLAAGHLSFKVKIGRGNWLQDRDRGYERDLWAIRTVHETAGKGGHVLVDANNYYTPEESIRLVRDTASIKIHWMEEMFKEDRVNWAGYRELRKTIRELKLQTLLADGESGRGDCDLLDLIKEGIIQVSQPDIRTLGPFMFRDYADQIRPFKALIAPHAWAKHIGVLEICLLGMVVPNFAMVEDCRLTSDVVKFPGLRIRNGLMTLEPAPGLGIIIDEAEYRKQCAPQEKTLRMS